MSDGAVSPSRCEPQGVLTHTNRERKALLKLIKDLCLMQTSSPRGGCATPTSLTSLLCLPSHLPPSPPLLTFILHLPFSPSLVPSIITFPPFTPSFVSSSGLLPLHLLQSFGLLCLPVSSPPCLPLPLPGLPPSWFSNPSVGFTSVLFL